MNKTDKLLDWLRSVPSGMLLESQVTGSGLGNVAIDRGNKLIAANDEIEQLRSRLESYRTRGRDLMLHDPEMRSSMDQLKDRLRSDPELCRELWDLAAAQGIDVDAKP